jgi:hypothetical protein
MSPHKFASAHPAWLQDAMPALAAAAVQDVQPALAEWGRTMHLPTVLKQAGLSMLEHLVGFLQEHPTVAQALDDFHGLSVVSDADPPETGTTSTLPPLARTSSTAAATASTEPGSSTSSGSATRGTRPRQADATTGHTIDQRANAPDHKSRSDSPRTASIDGGEFTATFPR